MRGGSTPGTVPPRRRGGITALHRRTLEALALAVGAHGGRAPGQLLRVGAYAWEIGRRMGLDHTNLDALQAASLLHDIGELAVPHQILSPAAGSTSDSFSLEKLKLHPTVGAGIVEQIGFPFPVAPLVRAHHERWDGNGYPDGLRGESIPIGARILSVADCLGSLPPAEALAALRAAAGAAFDPEIVRLLTANHTEIELAVQTVHDAPARLGFQTAIAAARHEERMLSELNQELGNSLSLDETLSTLDSRLKRLAVYHSIAFYLPGEDRLSPAYVSGENARQLCSIEIPFGHGVSGRVAELRQPILNPDSSVEGAASDVPAIGGSLRSTLAIPLENGGELVGVLALYHAAPGAFSKDDLRVLLAIRAKLSVAVANALAHERAEQLSVVDPLTCLPNARALFLRLDAELARCRRNRATLAVLVCEVDGIGGDHPGPAPIAGRRLRQSVAGGLRRICREDDFVARMGAGFVLVLSGFGPRDLKDKRKLIDSLMQEIGEAGPGGSLPVARLGAAFYPEDGAYAEDLLAAADSRLNPARPRGAAGKSRFALELAELGSVLERSAEPSAIPVAQVETDRNEQP